MRIITLFLLIITNALRLIDAKKKQNTQYQISKNAKSCEDEPDYQYLYSGKCHPSYEAAKAKDDDTTIAKICKEKDTVPRRPYICCFLQLY